MRQARRLQVLRGVGARRTVTALVTLCVAGVAASGSQVIVPAAEHGPRAAADGPLSEALAAPPVEVPGELSLLPGDSGLSIAGDHRARLVAGIPADAYAAYQRAAEIMESSAPKCRLEWSMLAAIGQVESRHGTSGGGRIDDDGIVSPALVGPPLDGKQGRDRVVDTDGGKLDGDRRFDRLLGPFRFTPSTWRVVGVDADGDGERDPQSVLDAAVGAGVALCGDGDDLGTSMGRKLALRGYNPDREFATRVLALADDYDMEGMHTSTPTAVPASAQSDLDLILSQARIVPTTRPRPATSRPTGVPKATPTAPAPSSSPRPSPSPTPTRTPKPTPTPSPTPIPTGTPSPSPTCSTPAPTPAPSPTPTPSPSPSPSPSADPTPTESPSPTASPSPTTSPTPTPAPSPSPSPTCR